eukprot:g7617.t1
MLPRCSNTVNEITTFAGFPSLVRALGRKRMGSGSGLDLFETAWDDLGGKAMQDPTRAAPYGDATRETAHPGRGIGFAFSKRTYSLEYDRD